MTIVMLQVLAGMFSLIFACVALVYLGRLLLELVRQWVDDSSDEVSTDVDQPYSPNKTLPGRRKDNTDESSTLPVR